MKGKLLGGQQISAWKNKYFDFQKAILLISACKKQNCVTFQQRLAQGEAIKGFLTSEMERVLSFYKWKLASLQDSYRVLLQSFLASEKAGTQQEGGEFSKSSYNTAFHDLYRLIELLDGFRTINCLSFAKAFKKFRKGCGEHRFCDEASAAIKNKRVFCPTRRLQKLRKAIEMTFSQHFLALPDRNSARQTLLEKYRRLPNWSIFQLGLLYGAVVVLVLWICREAAIGSYHRTAWHHLSLIYPLYQLCGCLTVVLFCWGLLVYGCHTYRINVRYILALEFREFCTPSYIFREAAVWAIALLLNILCMLDLFRYQAYGYLLFVLPLLLVIFILWRAFFPWKQQKFLLGVLFNTMISPYGTVKFVHTFVGDLMTSLVVPLSSVGFLVGYVATGAFAATTPDEFSRRSFWQEGTVWYDVVQPALMCFPMWWRFFQCLSLYHSTHLRWPHLANALKYACGLSVTVFGAFHPLWKNVQHVDLLQGVWVLLFVAATLYMYTWDILMDWGLFKEWGATWRSKPRSERKPLLQKEDSFTSTPILMQTSLPDSEAPFPRMRLQTVMASLSKQSHPASDSEVVIAEGNVTSVVDAQDAPIDEMPTSIDEPLLVERTPTPPASCVPAATVQRRQSRLRKRLIFPNKGFYWSAVVLDFFLRFAWTATLVPASTRSPLRFSFQKYLLPFLPIIEIFRRFIWAAIRLENQQLSNTEGYSWLDIVPMHFDLPMGSGEKMTQGKRVLLETMAYGVIMLAIVGAGVLT